MKHDYYCINDPFVEDFPIPKPKRPRMIGLGKSVNVSYSSIHSWISQIPAPNATLTPASQHPRTSPLSGSHQNSNRRNPRLRRCSEPLLSGILGNGPTLRKSRKALQEVSVNMAGKEDGKVVFPVTPKTSGSNITSSGENPSLGHINVSPSKLVAALKPRGNAYSAGELMEEHGMVFNDADAYESYPNFVDTINGIVAPERLSEARQESARKFQIYMKTFERLNEATFLHVMWPRLIKDGYHVIKERADFTEEEKEILRDDKMLFRDFVVDEGIMFTHDVEFHRILVPSINSDAKFELALAKALQKHDCMVNPKPDYVYGIHPSRIPRFRRAPRPPNVTALLQIAPGLVHPFLLVEGKADSGSAAEVENQARRGGATLVNAARQLRAMVGDLPDVVGPDEETFVFSITISPKLLEIWVHWYEGPEATQTFHMNKVKQFLLAGDRKQLGLLRDSLHNIMEWGALNRFSQLAGLHGSIHAYAKKVRLHEIEKADVKGPGRGRKRPAGEDAGAMSG